MKIRRVCFDDGLEGRREIGSNKGSRPSLSAPIRSSPYKMQRVHRQTASNRPFQIRGHDNARATVAFSSPFARRYFIVAKKERRSEKSCSFPSFRVKSEFFFWEILKNFELVRFILVFEGNFEEVLLLLLCGYTKLQNLWN